jgi:hypothetical protein
MPSRHPEVAWQRSAEIRAERKALRLSVQALPPHEAGEWLIALLRDPAPPADGVRLHELVRWLPGVGSAKADKLLAGLDGSMRPESMSKRDRLDLAGRIARRRLRRRNPDGVMVSYGIKSGT